jgi:hypothetical protein
MLTALTYGLLATALTAHAAPFPQAIGTGASGRLALSVRPNELLPIQFQILLVRSLAP